MQPAGPEDKGIGSDQRVCRRTAVAVLLVAAVLVATGTGLGGDFPGAITLNAGIATSFVIEIVNHLGLEVHSVRLRRPDSMWATTIADITEFQLEISATLDVLPFGGGKFGLIKATLGSAIMHLDFEGENLGTFQSQPLQLGGGGKIDSILEGKLHVAPDQKEAFQKIAWATVHRDTITLEIWSEVTVELRGVENGCLLGKVFCSSAGTFTIPHVKFAKSLSLRAANGFGVTLSNLRLSDTPLTIAADDALIEIDCVIDNPSSFELMDLDEIFLDVHTDLNMTMEMMVALGPRFAQVYTEPGFHLLRGRNLKTTVRGHLYAPSREHELVGAAGVFDSFVANSSTSLIALIAGSSQPFYAAAATNVLVRVSLPGIMWPGMSTFQVSKLEHAEPASSRGTLLGQYDNKLEDDAGAIIEMVQIDFNIPVAIATLAGSGLFGSSGCLEQYVRLTLKNPVSTARRVHRPSGLTQPHIKSHLLGRSDHRSSSSASPPKSTTTALTSEASTCPASARTPS